MAKAARKQAARRPRGPKAKAKDGTDRGRPSKFTPERQKRILDAIRAGNYLETAAAYGRVTYVTLNDWIKRGERVAASLPDDENALQAAIDRLDPLDREYLDFSEAVVEESAKAEMQALLEIKSLGQGSADRPPLLKAHTWWLEHRFPSRWGRKVEQREISGPGGKPIQMQDATPITDVDRLARLQKLLAVSG